jgi:hypothetical protein
MRSGREIDLIYVQRGSKKEKDIGNRRISTNEPSSSTVVDVIETSQMHGKQKGTRNDEQ